MKKLFYTLILSLLIFSGYTQPAFRLHVQAGKSLLYGDGDDFTTLIITARNSEGEVITSMSGKVKVGVSSGFPDETEVNMQSGVALVKFTAPMFGTPVKSSQRMVYFMFRFMQKFIATASGSSSESENRKLASGVALETFKEGFNPLTLIPKSEGDNFVYIVCEMNGVKGKAKIEISKATDGRNGSIVSGVYYGRDITGQSEWMLDITSGGEGYFGEANASSSDQVSILFTNEKYTEFDDAMGKMSGMTGFMKAYLGPPASEQKYYENYDIRTSGMSSAYMPMPNHGVFVYIPPILFEYAGRRTSDDKRDDGAANPEEVKTEKTGIVLSQNEIIGDGRSRTKAVFHFEDENGKPVSAKSVSWDIPKGLKVLSMETVTNPSGNAVVELEAPVIKATEEKRGENLKGLYDNYDIYQMKASYASLNGKTENTQTQLKVFKTLEQEIYILKPGMELTPYKVLLPQLEYYNLESSIYALLPESFMTNPNKKTPVNDAVVFLANRNFDRAEFQKKYDLFFLKDREMFLQMIENEKGGYAALTDASGKYKLIVRDFEGKMRLYSGDYDRKLNLEPLEAKVADLTGRHKGALTEALSLLAGGDAAVLASDNEGESSLNQSLHGLAFKEKVLAKLLNMEKQLCSGNYQEALYIQEKLHIIGMVMTNIKGSSRYVSDCANVFGEQAYEAIKFLVFFAAEKYKFNEKLFNKLGNTENAQKLKAAGIDLSDYVDTYTKGITEVAAKKSIAKRFLIRIVSEIKELPGEEFYLLLGHAANYALTETQKKMLDAVVDAVVYYSPTRGIIGEMIVKKYYAGQTEEVLKLLDQDTRKLHAVYEQLQPALRDRSTEIRQQYSNVAAWRLNLDDFKAYTDLFADLVAKGAVIIVDAYSGNYAAIQKHLEYIDKAKNVLNAAYHTASLGNEFISLRNLWAESDAVLIYANKCIDQGSMSPVTENRNFTIPLFPSAMAADGSGVELMKGVPAFSVNQLSLKNGRLPVNELNQMFNGFGKFNQWFSQYEDELLWISVDDPELATQLFKAREAYNDQLEMLTVLSFGIIDKPEDISLKTQWKEVSGQMEKTSTEIIKVSGEATGKMKTMQVNPPVNVPVKTSLTVSSAFGESKWLTYLLIGIGGLVVVVVLVLIFRKKRKKGYQAQPEIIQIHTPSRPVQTTAPAISTPKTGSVSMKFCTKCGAGLKPGAKFCGKCGNQQ